MINKVKQAFHCWRHRQLYIKPYQLGRQMQVQVKCRKIGSAEAIFIHFFRPWQNFVHFRFFLSVSISVKNTVKKRSNAFLCRGHSRMYRNSACTERSIHAAHTVPAISPGPKGVSVMGDHCTSFTLGMLHLWQMIALPEIMSPRGLYFESSWRVEGSTSTRDPCVWQSTSLGVQRPWSVPRTRTKQGYHGVIGRYLRVLPA